MKKIIISLILLISLLLASCAETQTEESSGGVTKNVSEAEAENSKVITENGSEIITENSEVITGESSEVIDESSNDIEISHKEPTQSFINECNHSSGGYAVFNGTHWFYYSFKDADGLYMCDANGNNVVCVDEFESTRNLQLKAVGDTVFYVKTELLETPIEIGEYEILFKRELRAYSNGSIKVVSSDNIVDHAISEGYIYYTASDLKVYRMKLDGTEKESIAELPYPMELQIVGDKIYTNMNEALYERNLDGEILNVYNIYHYVMAINENEIYYICPSELSLRYTNDYGETYKELAGSVISFCVFNNKLVYEIFDTKEIFMSDLDGKNPEMICKGRSPMAVNGHLLCVVDDEIISIFAKK